MSGTTKQYIKRSVRRGRSQAEERSRRLRLWLWGLVLAEKVEPDGGRPLKNAARGRNEGWHLAEWALTIETSVFNTALTKESLDLLAGLVISHIEVG